MEQDIVSRKSTLKTTNTPLGGSVLLRTLLDQQKVTDRSFDPLNRNFSNDRISDADADALSNFCHC